ncbi:hypothetical protein CRENBAI_012157 [Crenichthys baileyi]|uniref:Uncharacterized protein n=1 Tax=Crenichthys baileyi TaxID=28760 RepID=A0AAV9S1L4_9TELE
MSSFGLAEFKGIQGSKQKMKFQGLDAQGRGAFPLPLGFTPPEDPESPKKTSLDIIFNTGSNRLRSSAVTDVASSRVQIFGGEIRISFIFLFVHTQKKFDSGALCAQ